MSKFKLLVVEDDEDDLRTCRETVDRYQDEWQREVELVECIDVEEARMKLDDTFDGVIIDLRLGGDVEEGNEVIKWIKEGLFRFPTAVLTGTPDAAELDGEWVFKKGEARYDDILDRFWRIYDTGLTRILGGRGIIESKIGEVFQNNLLPQIKRWEKYGQRDSARTESALLRYTLNHLIQIIDEDVDHCFPEEFYLCPPVSEHIRTGSILAEKEGGRRFVVMSPDCDLVLRENGTRNTDKVLVVEVISPSKVFSWFDGERLSDIDIERLSRRKRRELERAAKNNRSGYYHCLPETDFFPLGFLNFRSLSVVGEEELGSRFCTPPGLQISPPFIKDIVARFSMYYARQGQPEIAFAGLSEG